MTQIIKRIDLILSLKKILDNLNNSKIEKTQETRVLPNSQSDKEEEALLLMK